MATRPPPVPKAKNNTQVSTCRHTNPSATQGRIFCAREEIRPCKGPTRTKNTAKRVSTRLALPLDSSMPWVIMGMPHSMTKTISGNMPL